MKEVSHIYNLCFGVSLLATHVLCCSSLTIFYCLRVSPNISDARFDSFAPVRLGRARWLVDGCDYMAAVAAAIVKVLPWEISCYQYNILLYFFSFCEYFLDSLIT